MVLSRAATLRGAIRPGTASGAMVVRAAAHLAAWLPLVYGVIRALQLGWVPTSDNAGIALRSWDVLTPNGPLVGQATRLANGVFDPGPLQYWLQTLPVHLDPVHGVLWGATLWCMLACSLTIEAAWAVAGRLGGLLASAITIGVVAWIAQIAVLPCWNPWFGMMFFIAALAAAFAVMCGHRGWWPVLMITASVAAQAHLMFTIASAALVLLALITGVVGSIRSKSGYWWVLIGVIAGLACWAAPVIQQFTSQNGNLGALIAGQGQLGPTAGPVFGFQALSAATLPPPFWWTPVDSLLKLSLIQARPAWFGIAALTVTALILIAAVYPLRSPRLAAIAGIGVLISVAALFTYARVPLADVSMTASTFNNLRYLMAPMYPVGVLTWFTAGSAVVLVGRRVLGRASTNRARGGAADAPAPAEPAQVAPAQAGPAQVAPAQVAPAQVGPAKAGPAKAGPAKAKAAPWAVRVLGSGVVALIVLATSLAIVQIGHRTDIRTPVMGAVTAAAHQIRRDLPYRQDLALAVVASSNHARRQLMFGLVYALRTAGYQTEIYPNWAVQLGPDYSLSADTPPMPHVTVYLHDSGSIYVKVHRPHQH